MARRKTLLPEVRREHESALGDFRVAAGMTIVDLAERARVSVNLIQRLQNGYASPVWTEGQRAGIWKPKTLAICAVLGAEPEDVFPGYACRLQYRGDLSPEQIHAITHVTEARDPEDRAERARELVPLLAAIRPKDREALVLTSLLGLTLDEAGFVLGVSHERVRQMVAKAMRTCRSIVAKRVLREAIPAQGRGMAAG
jgi:RNA polymerase sigma factor (sigma-70 family)